MIKPDIQAVLFDLDGTLLDTHDLLLESFRYAAREVLENPPTDELLMAKVGQPLDVQMWDFANDQAEHEELCRTYREYNARVHDDLIEVFPGTRPMLDLLKDAGIPLGVVTSKRHRAAVRGLALFELESYFEFVVGSDDWPEHKPHPGPVLHGCDRLGMAVASCLYVGDSPFDIQAGRAAGCPTAAALWGMFPREALVSEQPTFVCPDSADVPGLVLPGSAPAR